MSNQEEFHLRQYKVGEIIFQQGTVPDHAYVIESGEVEIYIQGKLGDQIISILKAGELFGEMGVVDNKPRTTYARAKTKVTLMQINREQITQRIDSADPIIKSLLELLLTRSRSMLTETGSTEDVVQPSQNPMIKNQGISKFRLESELRNAIAHGQIQTVFQPIIDIHTQKIAGCEALSRWDHPAQGMISPAKFITLAEETDLIIDVGYLVFKRVCELLSRAASDFFVSVNVSAKQLDKDDFFETVLSLLSDYSISAESIKLEITETMVVDSQRAKQWIERSKGYGFQICADDFGTGHSGILQLTELDYDILKIDQAFVRSMMHSKTTQTVLEGIVRMANDLSIRMVAEGIETEDEMDYLDQLGVQLGQGYWIGKAESVESLLKRIQ